MWKLSLYLLKKASDFAWFGCASLRARDNKYFRKSTSSSPLNQFLECIHW